MIPVCFNAILVAFSFRNILMIVRIISWLAILSDRIIVTFNFHILPCLFQIKFRAQPLNRYLDHFSVELLICHVFFVVLNTSYLSHLCYSVKLSLGKNKKQKKSPQGALRFFRTRPFQMASFQEVKDCNGRKIILDIKPFLVS